MNSLRPPAHHCRCGGPTSPWATRCSGPNGNRQIEKKLNVLCFSQHFKPTYINLPLPDSRSSRTRFRQNVQVPQLRAHEWPSEPRVTNHKSPCMQERVFSSRWAIRTLLGMTAPAVVCMSERTWPSKKTTQGLGDARVCEKMCTVYDGLGWCNSMLVLLGPVEWLTVSISMWHCPRNHEQELAAGRRGEKEISMACHPVLGRS